MERKDPPSLFSRHKVKDLARDLPTQLKDIEDSFNKMIKDFNNLPDYMDYLSSVVEIKSKNQIPDDINFWNLHTQLENNLELLLKLASDKSDLNEAARTRKALIKTGGVKDEIEKQLPQATLIQMIKDLAMAYQKYNDYVLPSMSNSIITYKKSENGATEDEISAYKYCKNFVEKKLDIKGKELRDLFSSILLQRDKLIKIVALTVKLYNNFYQLDKKLDQVSNEQKYEQKNPFKK